MARGKKALFLCFSSLIDIGWHRSDFNTNIFIGYDTVVIEEVSFVRDVVDIIDRIEDHDIIITSTCIEEIELEALCVPLRIIRLKGDISVTRIIPDKSETIISAILAEVERAESKHPEWPRDLVYMDQIINEEKGEATRAVLQYVMEGGELGEVKKELIETAAMCVRMLKNLPINR